MNPQTLTRTALAAALSLTTLLAACGGGGGGSAPTNTSTTSNGTPIGSTTSTSTASAIPAGTTQATPTYAQGSIQLAMFNQVNAYRQQCGFPAVQQNTLLDQVAQNHAQYMVDNGDQPTDSEVQGNPGFTGVTYQDRATYVGWPTSVGVGGGAAGWYNYDYTTNTAGTLTNTQWGQALVNAWASGVYHQALIDSPFNVMGFGVSITTSQNLQLALASESYAVDWNNPNDISASAAPLTFPCQGVTGIPYGDNGENPVPPNASSNGFGTPVAVIGRMSDTVILTSATLVNTATGAQITLNILNASNDPNKLLPNYQASAYPTSPLAPNTTYQANLSGTINGTPFTRTFTFTTGNTLA
jgi:uncharacterized protein YkwD